MTEQTTMTKLLFMAVVTLLPLSQAAAQASECNYNTSQSMNDRGISSKDLRADADEGLALVLSNYTFSCDGILQQWNIHWAIENTDRCEIILDFHVLRPTKRSGFCGLVSVGMHREVLITTPTRKPRPHQTVDSFNTNSSVRVEAGDVVGLVVMFNNSRRCRSRARVSILKAREPSDPGLVYLAGPASQEELTDDWRLENLSGFGCDDRSSDGRTRSRDRLPPGTPTRPHTPRSSTQEDSTSNEEGRRSRRRTPIKTKPTHDHNQFKVYGGAPLINTIVEPEVLTSEPVAETAALSEGGIDKEIGSGELQEQGADDAPDLSGIMIPTGLVLGLLLVVSVGVVAVACLCYRARQTHTKEGFDMSTNKAYTTSSATSPLPNVKEENPLVGRKPPVKPRPRYSMNDNTAYGTTPEEWGIPQQYSTPHYITPTEMGLPPKMVLGDYEDKSNDNIYIVDGKIYEIPSEV